jgi:hypothetical protein
MTAIIDRDTVSAARDASGRAVLVGHGTAAAPRRREAAQSRGVSPRLSRSRAGEAAAESTTVSNAPRKGDLRTAESAPSAVRIVGARGGANRTIERIRVRPATRRPRGISRVDGCARRTSRPTVAACVLAALGTFVGVLLLFGGADQATEAAPAVSATPALVTVRSGQTLEQVAREIAPGRPVAVVVGEVAELNGITDGRVHPGQTLVTPRY